MEQPGKCKAFLSGFTIIEVIIATGITVFALSAAYSAFRLGWRGYGRLNSQSLSSQELRGFVDRISKDLRNSFIFNASDNRAIPFDGTGSQMFFAALIKTKDKEGSPYIEAAKIFYKFEKGKLSRAYLKNNDLLKGSPEIRYEDIISNISDLKFSYLVEAQTSSGTGEWAGAFKSDVVLPLGVRIELTLAPKDALPLSITRDIDISPAIGVQKKE